MSKLVKHYESHYSNFQENLYREVRARVYGTDIGQNSWITADEQDMFMDWLRLDSSKKLLDVACGSGETTLRINKSTNCSVVGVDVQEKGIKNALSLVKGKKLEASVNFILSDGGKPQPFDTGTFDAIICIDAINHLPNRKKVFQEWYRLLKEDGCILFTDPIVVTGMLTKEEIQTRASIGYFLFTAEGVNEKLLKETGFTVLKKMDRTDNMALTARNWEVERERKRTALVSIEGHDTFEGQQDFFKTCAYLAEGKHLSRYAYFAGKENTDQKDI
ncbi:MAG: class I SAM-dependent methyltransferase [Bacteroidota bacterium]